jgi:hypothetical protein
MSVTGGSMTIHLPPSVGVSSTQTHMTLGQGNTDDIPSSSAASSSAAAPSSTTPAAANGHDASATAESAATPMSPAGAAEVKVVVPSSKSGGLSIVAPTRGSETTPSSPPTGGDWINTEVYKV